jgi:hypothetical protein
MIIALPPHEAVCLLLTNQAVIVHPAALQTIQEVLLVAQVAAVLPQEDSKLQFEG